MDFEDLLKRVVKEGGFKKKKKKYKSRDFEDVLAEKLILGLGAVGASMLSRSSSPPPPAPQHSTSSPSTSHLPPPPPVTRSGSQSSEHAIAPQPQPVREKDRQALMVLRAMVAAANADHRIEEDERRRILSKAEFFGLSDEERRFLHAEFDRPSSIQALVREVNGDVGLSRQVYLGSLLAIDVDTDAERFYLQQLAEALGIPESEIRELHEQAEL